MSPTWQDFALILQRPSGWLLLLIPCLVGALAIWAAWETLWPTSRTVDVPAPLTDRELAALLGQVQITYHAQATHFKNEETRNPSARVHVFPSDRRMGSTASRHEVK